MAIYHFSGSVVGRSSNPSASCAAASAYRSGDKIDEHDYTKKKGVAWSGMLYCDGCPEELKSREALWTAVDEKERRSDAQLFRSFDMAFPNEFSYDDCREVLTDFAQKQWVDKGMCADLAVHDTQYHGQRNLHGHAMLTMRNIDENGLGKKNRDWNEHSNMEQWREAWSIAINDRLRDMGSLERIDHRSFERQGETELQPTVHMGKEATALERNGVSTYIGELNRHIQAINERIRRSLAWRTKQAEKERKEAERAREDAQSRYKPLNKSVDGSEIDKLIERKQQDRDRGR